MYKYVHTCMYNRTKSKGMYVSIFVGEGGRFASPFYLQREKKIIIHWRAIICTVQYICMHDRANLMYL